MEPTQHIIERLGYEARQEDGLVGYGGTSWEAEANLRQEVREYNRSSTDQIVWQDCKVVVKPVHTFSAYQEGERNCLGRGDSRDSALYDLNHQIRHKGNR